MSLRKLQYKFDLQKKLLAALIEPIEYLFKTCEKDTWTSIRKLLKHETEVVASEFSSAIAGFELDQETSIKMIQNLRHYARNIVEKKAREEAGKVLIHMKDRFSAVFNHDDDSMPRIWTGKEDIRAITMEARSASLKLLSVMAAIRLDEKPDKIEKKIFSSLMDVTITVSTKSTAKGTITDPLASSTWEEVSPKDTVITPVQCKSLWRQFRSETEYAVTQAISAQEAYKQSNNWLPPPWAIVALIILGFNEFMLLLKNPLHLLVLFVVYLLSKALWVQADIAGEFRNGTLAGLLSMSSRFLPTVMNLLRRLAEEAQGNPMPQASERPASAVSQGFRHQTHPSNSLTNSISESSESSNISSSDDGVEYSSPDLTRR